VWRAVRIGVLLVALLAAASSAWFDRQRTSSWTDTLWVGIYPVDADGRDATRRYIAALTADEFAPVESFFRREAGAHGVALDKPVQIELYPRVAALPPRLESGSGAVAALWWSLRMRWYTWRSTRGTLASIRVFVLYHDPEVTPVVPHSLGLQKGLLGVVYAYADATLDDANDIVIAHEVMHTLGATDKYDPRSNLPLYPQGYGDRGLEPRHPQQSAEIMAGRVALSPTEARMPDSLDDVVAGPETAAEINWIAPH
jgi:hypothetical protein